MPSTRRTQNSRTNIQVNLTPGTQLDLSFSVETHQSDGVEIQSHSQISLHVISEEPLRNSPERMIENLLIMGDTASREGRPIDVRPALLWKSENPVRDTRSPEVRMRDFENERYHVDPYVPAYVSYECRPVKKVLWR
jgi:hypothetical protein